MQNGNKYLGAKESSRDRWDYKRDGHTLIVMCHSYARASSQVRHIDEHTATTTVDYRVSELRLTRLGGDKSVQCPFGRTINATPRRRVFQITCHDLHKLCKEEETLVSKVLTQ